jgi:ubiquinol-cytochrome c reductase cytochrome c1 subunit
VEYPEGAPEATVEQMARDVAAFMAWTAEPERVDRQNLGVYVLLYLVIFAGLSFMVMKRIWRNVKK